jgi:hypothetical protein
MLVIPAFRVRIWSAIMHVSLVCVINSFSVFSLFFSFFFEYDLKHNRTRKCCARNSWFFCTILHCYHNRLSTNYFCWFLVTRPTKTKLNPNTFYWSACTKPGSEMSCICVLGFWHCICFYSFWLDFGTVPPAV